MLTGNRSWTGGLARAAIGAALASNAALAKPDTPITSARQQPPAETRAAPGAILDEPCLGRRATEPAVGPQRASDIRTGTGVSTTGSVSTRSGATSPSTRSATPAPPIGDSVPVSIHADGRDGPLVVVPEGLFNGQWTANLTTAEIGGGGITLRGGGRYPSGSLAQFDLADYLEVLEGAVRLHVPEDVTGFATLDYEGGLYPWAEKTRAIYKEGMTDEAYERAAHAFFIESLRTAKAARPNVKWSFYGYPHSWEIADLTERIRDIYAECDAVSPSLYIRHSGDTEKIKANVDRIGSFVAAVQALHPLGEDLPATPYVWHRYSSVDKNDKAYHPVTTEDFSTTISAAKPWADQFVMWMGATSPLGAAYLSEELAEGGRIRELVYTSRRAK